MRALCYDRNGKAITVEKYSRLFGDKDYVRVALDKVAGRSVSTVWLGIDHNHSERGAPLIFETAVFLRGDCDIMARYSTEAEARSGHAAIVRGLKLAAKN